MKVRTKAKVAGPIVDAVVFNGDPAIHPFIYASTDPSPHFRFKDTRYPETGSVWLDVGSVIISRPDGRFDIINKKDFDSDYELCFVSRFLQ